MLKTRIRIGTSLEKSINEKFTKLSEETRLNKTKLLDEAITDLLVKYEKKKELYK